jgi:hypothetical protein
MLVMSAKAADAPVHKQLVAALIQVESNGNDRAIGDRGKKEMAYGCLQIRKPCVDDVNKALGTKIKAQDCLGNRDLSIKVCATYISLYATKNRLGKDPTLQDMARIWNGGPNGWKFKSTNVYWAKVQKHLKNSTEIKIEKEAN